MNWTFVEKSSIVSDGNHTSDVSTKCLAEHLVKPHIIPPNRYETFGSANNGKKSMCNQRNSIFT